MHHWFPLAFWPAPLGRSANAREPSPLEEPHCREPIQLALPTSQARSRTRVNGSRAGRTILARAHASRALTSGSYSSTKVPCKELESTEGGTRGIKFYMPTSGVVSPSRSALVCADIRVKVAWYAIHVENGG